MNKDIRILNSSRITSPRVFSALIIGLGVFLTLSIQVGAQEKKSVAVLDFESPKGKQYWDMGKNASDYLTVQLAEIGSFRVIERKQIEKILKEHELGMIGVVRRKFSGK